MLKVRAVQLEGNPAVVGQLEEDQLGVLSCVKRANHPGWTTTDPPADPPFILLGLVEVTVTSPEHPLVRVNGRLTPIVPLIAGRVRVGVVQLLVMI